MREQLEALRTRYQPRIFNACRVLAQGAVRTYRITLRVSRRTLDTALRHVETVLLSAPARERLHAAATFSLIFLFAVTSVDFLIAGGAEFGAPARAAQSRSIHAANTAPAPETVVLPPLPDGFAAVPTSVAETLSTTRQANVVAVSQSFEAPAPRAAALESDDLVPVHATEAEAAALAGETPVAEPVDEAPAPAAKRVKPRPQPAPAGGDA